MSQTPLDVVKKRYRDAYAVAKVVIGFGNAVKIIGLLAGVAGALAVVGALAVAKILGGAAIIAGGILGLLPGLVVYILGALIVAQGQIQYAILDVAVNTSPILLAGDKEKLLAETGAATPPVAEGDSGIGI